jgi:hypothetical protein
VISDWASCGVTPIDNTDRNRLMITPPEPANKNSTLITRTLCCFAFVIAAWAFCASTENGGSAATAGQFGDKFGSVNALFTGLALVGLIATLTYQISHAEDAEKETKKILGSLEQTANALKTQAELTSAQIAQQKEILWDEDIVRERSLIKALYCEMSVAWDSYRRMIGPDIEALDGNSPLVYEYPRSPDYFPIYRGNGSLFGRMTDDEMRIAFVAAYVQATALLSMLEYNNKHAFDDRPESLPSRVEYANKIKKLHDDIKETFKVLENYYTQWLAGQRPGQRIELTRHTTSL